MWWKIYFGIIVLLALVVSIGSFATRFDNFNPFSLFHLGVFYIEFVGLYAFLFHKEMLSRQFWKYFFWLNVVLDVAILLYAFFPHIAFSPYLKAFFVHEPKADITLFISELLDIPSLYALYFLSKGIFADANSKPKKSKKPLTKQTRFRWGMVQMALWGYASVLTFFLFILAFFPSRNSEAAKAAVDYAYLTSITVMFAPLLIFWLWVVIRYKQYRWNWWRTTLVANALLYSGLIIFGILVPSSDQGPSGFDFISVLQLFILLLSLYVFGKEQFSLSTEDNQ